MSTRRFLLLALIGYCAVSTSRSLRRLSVRRRLLEEREEVRRWEGEGGAISGTGPAVDGVRVSIEVNGGAISSTRV